MLISVNFATKDQSGKIGLLMLLQTFCILQNLAAIYNSCISQQVQYYICQKYIWRLRKGGLKAGCTNVQYMKYNFQLYGQILYKTTKLKSEIIK